jgi:hypothetical protein
LAVTNGPGSPRIFQLFTLRVGARNVTRFDGRALASGRIQSRKTDIVEMPSNRVSNGETRCPDNV